MGRAMRLSLVKACLYSNMFLFLGAQTYTTFNGFYFVSNRHQDLAKATVTRRDVTSDRSGNYAGRSHSAFSGAFNSGFLRIARAAKRDAEDGLRSGQQTYQDDWNMSGKMTMYSPEDTPPNNQFLRIGRSGQDSEELPPGTFYL